MNSRTRLNRPKPPLRRSSDLDLWGKGRTRVLLRHYLEEGMSKAAVAHPYHTRQDDYATVLET